MTFETSAFSYSSRPMASQDGLVRPMREENEVVAEAALVEFEASRAPEAVLGGGGAVGPVSNCNDHPW